MKIVYIIRIFICICIKRLKQGVESQIIGNLTGNLVICKFKADNSTGRTILFSNSCHVSPNNTVPLSIVKINSDSEWEVASWNIKRMKMN